MQRLFFKYRLDYRELNKFLVGRRTIRKKYSRGRDFAQVLILPYGFQSVYSELDIASIQTAHLLEHYIINFTELYAGYWKKYYKPLGIFIASAVGWDGEEKFILEQTVSPGITEIDRMYIISPRKGFQRDFHERLERIEFEEETFKYTYSEVFDELSSVNTNPFFKILFPREKIRLKSLEEEKRSLKYYLEGLRRVKFGALCLYEDETSEKRCDSYLERLKEIARKKEEWPNFDIKRFEKHLDSMVLEKQNRVIRHGKGLNREYYTIIPIFAGEWESFFQYFLHNYSFGEHRIIPALMGNPLNPKETHAGLIILPLYPKKVKDLLEDREEGVLKKKYIWEGSIYEKLNQIISELIGKEIYKDVKKLKENFVEFLEKKIKNGEYLVYIL